MYTFSPLLWLLWGFWLFMSWGSVWKVRKFSRLFLRPRRTGHDLFRPRATVIVPFKGVDADLASGVRSLCTQDYPDYRLLLIVDSREDPAFPVLERELSRYPGRGEILVAGPAGPREGQKVRNQLFALARLDKTSADDEAWVFADSDAVPGPTWLGDLVGPLGRTHETAVTTGYRWLIPIQGASIWTDMASVMNASVACQLGKDELNHVWGGSMAVLAGIARRGRLRERLEGALCDDYQFTRMARDLKLRVYFVPRCLVATPANFSLYGLVNFAHRQYLLTRIYAPGIFCTALAIMSVYVVGLASVLVALGAALLGSVPAAEGGAAVGTRSGLWNWPAWYWPAGVLALGLLADQARASLRGQAVQWALGPQAAARLKRALALDRWATPLWMTLHWMLIVRSSVGRVMLWRGIRYRLSGPQSVERLG